jgi:predicted nucleotidyltransferase component of viral defense system
MADPRGQEQISADYRQARDARDPAAMRRLQNEEACLVLLAILERLAFEKSSFIHDVALKGGILMAGELHSPRSSADIDATTGHMQRLDADQVISDLRRAGRTFNVRPDGQPERTAGGLIVHFRFDSLTDSGTAKLEVSVREDLVFAVRDAFFDVSSLGIAPFEVHAVAQVELVAEKLRTVVQRAQPRDLFDLRFYLV